MDKHSQKTYARYVKNPIQVVRNWSKSTKKQAAVSLGLTTVLLAQAEMISLPKNPNELLALLSLPIALLLLSPFIWFLLMNILEALHTFFEWLQKD